VPDGGVTPFTPLVADPFHHIPQRLQVQPMRVVGAEREAPLSWPTILRHFGPRQTR